MPTADAYPEPGERIGPYEVVRRIGAGGMGLVYEAVDTVLNRRVALKVISPHLASDPTFRVRFTQEAQAQASLDSPHVVQVFAHGEADGALYIASQLIPDGDLGAMLRTSGAPPPRIAIDLIRQIATGLADAHAMGLVHRDIKPPNVLLRIRDEDVSAYLADFGIARRTDVDPNLTTQGFAVGTPAYMAPELHTGSAAGPMSDVYSLGCLLWSVLTGRAPYVGTTDYQVVSAHVSAPIPQLAVAGPFEAEVNRVLRTAMAKQPGDRYGSAADLRDDLRRLRDLAAPAQVRPATEHVPSAAAAPTPVPFASPSPTPQSFRPPYPTYAAAPPRRRAGLVVAVALVGVLVVVAGGVGLFVLLRDDGGGGGGAGDGSTTPATTDEHGLGPDEQEAAANISAALAADGELTTEEADCTARKLVQRSGIDGLQEDGVIDDDLEFVADDGGDVDPEVLADIFAVSFQCVFETASIDEDASSSG